jgi:predicted PurR-regulated permease PerM
VERMAEWLDTAARRGWQLVGVALGLTVLWFVFQRLYLLVATVFVAVLLAALFVRPQAWLEDHGMPRTLATVTVVVGGMLVLGAVLFALVLRFVTQAPQLVDQVDRLSVQVRDWLHGPPLHLSSQELTNLVQNGLDRLANHWQTIADQALQRTLTLLKVVVGFLGAVVLAFFLVRDRRKLITWTLERTVRPERRELAWAVLRRAWHTLEGYIRGTVIIGLLDAVLIGSGLLVLGVPLAVPLMGLTFFGSFFPIIGATVAGGVAIAVATVSNGLSTGLIVALIVIVVQQVDGNVFQPGVMSHEIDLHPVVILLVLTAGGLAGGIIGAAMAVPVTAILANVGNEIRTWEG